MKIIRINKEDTWEIRHRVMWPDKDISYVKLEDDDAGIHYGLYEDDKLISILSLFIDGDQAQFRKFATLREEQGKGYGSLLLNYVINEAKVLDVKTIWCNARKNKTGYYKKFGLEETKNIFEKGGIQYIIMEKQLEDES
ncbi:MAG: GNAT family N-acetyltransferase [Bacillota bacterium]